jgi:hypothetical protein
MRSGGTSGMFFASSTEECFSLFCILKTKTGFVAFWGAYTAAQQQQQQQQH